MIRVNGRAYNRPAFLGFVVGVCYNICWKFVPNQPAEELRAVISGIGS
jgi:hypothetical protein